MNIDEGLGARVKRFLLKEEIPSVFYEPVVFLGEKRDPKEDVRLFKIMVDDFKDKYPLLALESIFSLTEDQERQNYMREQAKIALAKIFQVLGILHRETTISKEELSGLVDEYTKLLNAVGMRRNNGEVTHEGLIPPDFITYEQKQ